MVFLRIYRRISPRTFVFAAISVTVLWGIYYTNYTSETNNDQSNDVDLNESQFQRHFFLGTRGSKEFGVCQRLGAAETDVNTVDVFKDFDFQPSWMRNKEYWDKTFEDRYERQKMDPERPPLKVFVVPHSHNDPGWLKTFEQYFQLTSRQIMNNMVTKLQQYKNLTFIWSEVSFLNAWWEEAHPSKQRALKELVQSGRLEITTGGWVMTDEANVHLYAMLDQLIEGHQWVWNNLGIRPVSGWSVDPFGHGSTVPFLLGESGLTGTVIQRIHYAWKQWLALKQYGDFKWVPNWNTGGSTGSILTHNQPFDIYSIKHSCGPHPYVCLNFDFRKVNGEYTEYSIKSQAITEKNVKEKAELLLEQYARTGSLLPHNTVLMPLGDDFRYNVREEWDQQYTNYMKMMEYINAHKEHYKAEVVFGTPAMYFKEITKRYQQYPTLKGDFFVYSDIFAEGRPAYWSGYFTTRPFMKILDRELENNLRAAEIVYTIALNSAKQNMLLSYSKVLERDYEKLVRARRNLGLFQHHDAITGTSKSIVMRDYGHKLFESIRDTNSILQNSIQSLLFPDIPLKPDQKLVLSDIERELYEKLPKKTPIPLGPDGQWGVRKIAVYNSLTRTQDEVIKVRVTTSNVRVTDDKGQDVIYQINPVWEMGDYTKVWVSKDEFELIFLARMPALSVTTYTLTYTSDNKEKAATIYCKSCGTKPASTDKDNKPPFRFKDIPQGDIQLENAKLKVLISGETGFMKNVVRMKKGYPKVTRCAIQFAAYQSAQYHSGAYLFMPDPSERDGEKDVLQHYKDQKNIMITTGPVSTELTVAYGPFLTHTVSVVMVENTTLAEAIFIDNTVDFENPPKNRETEMYMRLVSDVQNGEPPEFYTDSNGFSMQRRLKVESIGVEGNYFPITTMAYIQDNNVRLTLLTNHAQGAASYQPGFLEVMLERRTLYDDARGMGEGLVDNRRTVSRYVLLIEEISESPPPHHSSPKRFDNTDEAIRSFNVPTEPLGPLKREDFSRPSLYAVHLSNSLNYPSTIYIIDHEQQKHVKKAVRLVSRPFPCDTHLMTLRTQPDAVYNQFPSSSALMVLHRQGYDCGVYKKYSCHVTKFTKDFTFHYATVKDVEAKSLTGIDSLGGLKSFDEVFIEPMTLKTYNVTFG